MQKMVLLNILTTFRADQIDNIKLYENHNMFMLLHFM